MLLESWHLFWLTLNQNTSEGYWIYTQLSSNPLYESLFNIYTLKKGSYGINIKTLHFRPILGDKVLHGSDVIHVAMYCVVSVPIIQLKNEHSLLSQGPLKEDVQKIALWALDCLTKKKKKIFERYKLECNRRSYRFADEWL